MSVQIVIVGSGVAGLTLAEKLLQQGIHTIIIERENTVGGLARSFLYNNGVTFDIGPHRFHTDNRKVQDFIKEILGDNLITIDRNSQVFLFGRYLPWPITIRSVLTLPPGLLIRASSDLVFRRKAQTESFRDYVIERYGNTLFHVFFKPYTEKFLRHTCENLHRDWASAGINRATIDKQIQTHSLVALIKSVLFPQNSHTKFLYPKTGGIGAFSGKLAENILQRDGRILLSTEVSQFITNKRTIRGVVTDRGEEILADYVFWSGSLSALHRIGSFPDSVPKMPYISTVLLNCLVSEQADHDFQWCYVSDENIEANRISIPRNFNPGTVPCGKDAFCVEMACTEDSQIWNEPSRFDSIIETSLLRMNLIKSLDAVEDIHIEKVRQTYPLYTLNYLRKLQANVNRVEEQWENLVLLGRTGRFWYNNMDHSIAASLRIAEQFITDHQKGHFQKSHAYSVEDRYFEEST